MPKEIIVTAIGNRIEYATTDGKGLITGKREDVTEQAISAVFAYLKTEHERNNENGKGYGRKFEGQGRLLYVAPGVKLVLGRGGRKMTYTQDDCIRDTKEHISQVREFMLMFAQELIQRALVHDQSKLESPELEIFTEYTPKLRNSTYGTEEYKKNLEGMKWALEHHYMNNSHHPEHYEGGIKDMTLADIVEMMCDWKAATLRHADGDIYKSIGINKDRFGYSDDLYHIFRNTALMFEKED